LAPVIRDLTHLEDCDAVVRLQAAVWGESSDIVPASVLSVSAKRGGILLGAADDAGSDGATGLLGFVWSLPARRDGEWTQWSHMLAVLPSARGRGLGIALKLAQRERALAQGLDLIEWTFDPLQARNAHLNMTRLGCVASSYLENAYGSLEGPLFSGTPTDRLVAEWWIRRPHVERRVAAEQDAAAGRRAFTARAADVADAQPLIVTRPRGRWAAPEDVVPLTGRRATIAVPAGFSEMQAADQALALEWRLVVRRAFEAAFDGGYRVVDFFFDRQNGDGRYLLAGDEA
jgi:predicted GNAT superfamily acetyltransferase